MECPECGSTDAIRAGSVAGVDGKRIQRYKCKGCGKKFHPSLNDEKPPGDDDLHVARAELGRARRREEGLRREVATLKAERRELESEAARLKVVATIRAAGVPDAPPDWLVRTPRDSAAHHATVMALLSDTHFDEVVRPSEVNWRNAYNREIAEQRLQQFFRKVVQISQDYFASVTYDGCVLMLGGDILSGVIHDELVETNAATMMQGILHWTPRLAEGIAYLADTFGRVHVPVVIGNHPRFTRKPRSKLRALDNADWLIGQMLADRLAADTRITFDVPDSTDAFVRVYDTRFLLTHGDQTSGGGGIGGIWPPIMRMRARKLTRYSPDQAFDWLAMGHWHQLIPPTQGLIVNGALVGYSEFSAVNNFKPERAQQAMWLVTPENGVTLSAPVFVDDPAAEGWSKRRKK